MVLSRPPGVFIEREAPRAAPIGLLPSGIPCFFGLAERGPTAQPLRVTSHGEFRARFGNLDVGSYLDAAIDGFFLNGGQECYVVRIAHLFERGRKEIATRASVRLRDKSGSNTLQVQAISEGMWGNAIRVSVELPPAKIETFLTVDAHVGDASVLVKSTYGFARGTLVRIHDDDRATYRVLQRVDGRTLFWNEREPLENEFRSAAPTLVEPVGFDLTIETHSDREVFRGLNLARQSPQFAERVINRRSRLIEVANLNAMTATPDNFPVPVQRAVLDGGTDGLYTITAEDFIGADINS